MPSNRNFVPSGFTEETPGAGAEEPLEPAAAILRHALRQPLNHIIGYSELLLEEARNRQMENFMADLEKIRGAAGTLLSMLASIAVYPEPGSEPFSAPLPESASYKERQAIPGLESPAAAEASTPTPAHLLVVDDDELNRDLLARNLRQQGYLISVAEDGNQALEMVKAQPFDLVLLDVLMPGMDGFATCRALKTQAGTNDIPIIFMTALADTVDKVQGLRLGAVDYITKPFHQAEVNARVTTHLALERLKIRLQESEERLSRIVESAMDAIVTVDQTGSVVVFNRAAERMFRCQAADAIGQPVRRFLSEDLFGMLANYMGHRPAQIPVWMSDEHSVLRADGEPFPVESSVSHVEANGQTLYTFILRDLQERRKAEAERERLQDLASYLQNELRVSQGSADPIGNSEDLREVLQKVALVAETSAAVLILGETGTGKEVIARLLHTLSKRSDKVLVKLNCAAIPTNLVESELFGHEKGAFTGALTRKLGRFELADKGTLFLDEIGELPLDMQAKLLRVLQEGEFERVGGSETRKVDVRIIAATNRELISRVREGSFRSDLFYRLNVFPIRMPPLRDRKKDLPKLIEHFVRHFAEKYGKRIETVPARAMTALRAYDWPGNVRELQHVIERAVILTRGMELVFDRESLPEGPASQETAPRIETLEMVERTHIIKALDAAHWRVSGRGGAAEFLGLNPSTLQFRMKKLGIVRPS
ncbi:MAG: sigma 54-interacting transcriptional regulator [Methylococcaceae bacterium]|nr:sigma 54-interacting transcriptional regulator [Methylococcaceae bacterium]